MRTRLTQPPGRGLWHINFATGEYERVEKRWFPLWRLSIAQLMKVYDDQLLELSSIEPYRLGWPEAPPWQGFWLYGNVYQRVDGGAFPSGQPHVWDARGERSQREAWGALTTREGSPATWVSDLLEGKQSAWFTTDRGRDVWVVRKAISPEEMDRPITFFLQRIR